MTSEVEICNIASRLLGQGEISSIDPPDDSVQAIMAAQLYPHIRQWVLRKHTWHSCKKRVILSPDATAPPFDFNYQFTFPADWLRTLQVGYRGQSLNYEIDARKFLCNDTVLPLAYVFDNQVSATYDPALVHVLIIAMKHAMCYAFTKSAAMVDAVADELRTELQMARSIDGIDEPADTLGDFPLLAAGLARGR